MTTKHTCFVAISKYCLTLSSVHFEKFHPFANLSFLNLTAFVDKVVECFDHGKTNLLNGNDKTLILYMRIEKVCLPHHCI